MTLTLMLTSVASAFVDPKCADFELPDDYDEQSQQDFLANYVALATSLSPQHGPIPHQPGHGAVGVDLGLIPPLGCRRRLVLNGTKTEDTNKTPVVPRIRVSFALPAIGRVVPWAGVAYIPPVPLLGTTNVIVSGELGAGLPIGDRAQVGLRYHFSHGKTVGEIATPFVEGDPAVLDFYSASTFGFDAMFGYALGSVTPYAAVGLLDASTFFYIGDDAVVTNNLHPYLGPAMSAGLDGLIAERFRFGAELFVAPGGHARLEQTPDSLPGFGRYGHLVTARVRLAVEL